MDASHTGNCEIGDLSCRKVFTERYGRIYAQDAIIPHGILVRRSIRKMLADNAEKTVRHEIKRLTAINKGEKMEVSVSFYRLKSDHSVYLMRDLPVCGGGENTNWYVVTTDIVKAIGNYIQTVKKEGSFESKFELFGKYTPIKYTLVKDMEFDGFFGQLKKEMTLYATDFEKVTLSEVKKEVIQEVKNPNLNDLWY